jgi:hypothetical protein
MSRNGDDTHGVCEEMALMEEGAVCRRRDEGREWRTWMAKMAHMEGQ